MGQVNLPPSKRGGISATIFLSPIRRWTPLDFVCFCFFAAVFVFFLLVFTSLGDSLAASGRRTLALSSDPHERERILAIFEEGGGIDAKVEHRKASDGAVIVDACPPEEVDHMPCEDPRKNGHLSRRMNFYRERHCPKPEDSQFCLIPPPSGYRVPVPWPESLHKSVK